MALFDTNAITSAANSDGEFKLAARLWNADIRFEVGPEAYLLRMREGRISEFSKIDAPKWDVKISAPESDWRAFAAGAEALLSGFDGGGDAPEFQARRRPARLQSLLSRHLQTFRTDAPGRVTRISRCHVSIPQPAATSI